MAESSAKGGTKLPKSGDKPISSSAAPKKDGTGHRHRRERFKSLLKRPFSPASSKTPSTSSLHASLPTKDSDGEQSGNRPASTDLASGKKPEASSVARSSSSTAQASQSTPRSGNASAPAGKGYGTVVPAKVPIAEIWNQAYEQLREKEPNLIRKYEEEISLHVSTMVGTTVAISGLGKVRRREQMEVLVKQKLEEDEDGKWRIPLGDDRIAVRDLAGHVFSIVDWGKEFVGTVLESSPYGSIAWAGVCLLLPLILNPSKQRTSNICGLEYISDLLSRCALYEHAYHQRYEINPDKLSHKELDLTSGSYQSALKELYMRILRFQARSVCQFSRNFVSGGVRAMFKMDDWDALLEDIKLQEANCQTFFDSVKDQEALDAREEGHRHRTSLLLGKLEELNLGIKGIRNKLEEIHFSDEESKCFETLRTSNYLARKDLNPERLTGTCKWFLDHQKYLGWVAQNPVSRLLWVSADPGCGKSVLAKALVDQYDRGSVCYYFFKDDTTVTRSAAHAICAILHQICDLRPALIKYILPVYRRNGAKLVDLFEDLWSAFNDMINDKDFGNVICILDAIDECSDDDSKKLLPRLATITTSSNSIKILITSRPYISIENALFHKTGLDKNEICLSGEANAEQSMIEQEIGDFITSKVQDFRKLRESREIYDNAHKNLQSHLDGIKNRSYLWVSAVFSELEREVYAPEYILMETIKELPENVDKAYESILEKSPANKKLILKRVLHVMLVAYKPLSLTEMNVVLSIQDTSSGPKNSDLYPEKSFHTWLRDLCGFFVNIVDNDIYFAHQTAREFLIGEDGYRPAVGWKGSFQLAYSHTLLAQICIDYLLLWYDGSVGAAFQDYATIYWPRHCQSFEKDQSLADKVKFFLFQNGGVAPSFETWTATMPRIPAASNSSHDRRIIYSTGSPPTPLFLACDFGWHSIISVLMTFPDSDWNKKSNEGETGLQIAAYKGHVEIMKLLLNAGADVNIENSFGETALHYATSRGDLETLKLLLDAGADINTQGRYRQTALHSAAVKGYLEIVKLCLNARANVNIRDQWNETPLHWAASRGNFGILKLLISAGAEINIEDQAGETPLYYATGRDNLKIVKFLLTVGADANVPSFPRTPLHRAASRGNFEIVKLLASAGAEINIKDQYGETPLHCAAEQGNLETVKLLLTAGADANIPRFSRTALHIATKQNHVEIVETLLAAGAIDSSTDSISSSVESLANSRSRFADAPLDHDSDCYDSYSPDSSSVSSDEQRPESDETSHISSYGNRTLHRTLRRAQIP